MRGNTAIYNISQCNDFINQKQRQSCVIKFRNHLLKIWVINSGNILYLPWLFILNIKEFWVMMAGQESAVELFYKFPLFSCNKRRYLFKIAAMCHKQ